METENLVIKYSVEPKDESTGFYHDQIIIESIEFQGEDIMELFSDELIEKIEEKIYGGLHEN